jgi:enamine deaminase RidA (YjgF/YER057c/UK114 family)
MVADGGELVTVAGQVGVGASGALVGADVGSQTRQVFANVRAIVEAAGCTMADVVRLQTFLVDADDIPGFMKARQEIFPEYFPAGAYPPNTLLVVSRLVRPELKVEVEAMAVRRRSAPKSPTPRPPSRSKRPSSSPRRRGGR